MMLALYGGLLAGCSASRKATRTETKKNIPLILSSRQIHSFLEENHIDFRTFSAKIRLGITTGSTTQNNITAFVRMQKDSVIWISVRPFLGIELERILITPDSVKLINYLKKTVYLQDADSLQQLLDVPFNFATLQDILIGNPPIITNDLENITKDSAKIGFHCHTKQFSAQYELFAGSFLLKKSRLVDKFSRRSSDQQYNQYTDVSGQHFALERKLSVQAGSEMDVTLQFSNITFDRPLIFPFSYGDQFAIQ